MKQNRYLLLVLVVLLGCAENGDGFFSEMPKNFDTDSLTVQKDLFASLRIQPIDKNEIEVKSNDCTLLPFCGNLRFQNDTIYHRASPSEAYRPYLVLNARRFDTLMYVYSPERVDKVVYIGLMWDEAKNDSLKYFQLIPVKRKSPFHTAYVKYVSVKNGGIQYITFSSYTKTYTISITKFPKVVWSSR
jgi:hypothetical protein